MCAAEAAARGRRVLLLDHAKKIGERIRISGGGRCNFTNRHTSHDAFLSHNPHFVRSALAQFSQWDFIARVEQAGIAYHEKTLGQLFCDDSSQQIIDLLLDACKESGVELLHPCEVKSISHEQAFLVATDKGGFSSESLVVATGGLAIPKLGATPLGYQVAEQFEHKVIKPLPALVPLALSNDDLNALDGLSGVSIPAETLAQGNKQSAEFKENVLFTHRGLSGPLVLQLSSYWQAQSYEHTKRQAITVNLMPTMSVYDWFLEQHGSKQTMLNILSQQWPKRFAQAWCDAHEWDKPINQYSHKALRDMADGIEQWSVMPSGTLGFAKAEVTLGGVDTDELSSKTMESKKQSGLYFIGEVVDVTGWLGGYNFQWAWSSGWVAGQHC